MADVPIDEASAREILAILYSQKQRSGVRCWIWQVKAIFQTRDGRGHFDARIQYAHGKRWTKRDDRVMNPTIALTEAGCEETYSNLD